MKKQLARTSQLRKKNQQIAVVFKTHLDVGFTDLAENVLRRYFDQFIPQALDLAAKTRGTPYRLVWTTGSWLAFRFLQDAPLSERKKFEEAVRHGDICWHALPFTTHTELLDPGLFRQGLAYAQMLDKRFGRKTIAAKMTDVPGHTRGIVPLLAEAGVRLLHIGVNPASRPPSVPPIFRWKCAGREIIVIYESVYGATTPLPGGRLVSVNLTGDNLGPQTPEQVAKIYESLSQRFPGARLKAAGLDSVANYLWRHRKVLPIVEKEIGDTWIHGVGSDPGKVAAFRELTRLRTDWISRRSLVEGGPIDVRFSENLLLVAEHTWGMDIKTHLKSWNFYAPQALKRARKTENFQLVESSWDEQRQYIRRAVSSLPAPLRKEATAHLKTLTPARVRTKGWEAIQPSDSVTLGQWKIQLDPEEGFIRGLSRRPGGKELIDVKNGLARLSYQTFSQADYERFFHQYNTMDRAWVKQDFTKIGLPASARSEIFYPRLKKAFLNRKTERLHVISAFPSRAKAKGAPGTLEIEVSATDSGIDIVVQWFDKMATRLPEAVWLGFAPKLGKQEGWKLEKTGAWLDPGDVVPDGNRHLHAVSGRILAGANFSLDSLDATLVSPGKPRLLDHSNQLPSRTEGIYFNLYNNVWGTNFVMWNDADAKFRFGLKCSNIAEL